MNKYRRILIPFVLFFSILVLCVGCGNEPADHTGEAQIPEKASELEGKNYEEVQKLFTKAGFTNIELEPLDDLITGWLNDEGEVKEVLIDGDTEYIKTSWVSDDTPVVIRYHSFKEKIETEETEQSSQESEEEVKQKQEKDQLEQQISEQEQQSEMEQQQEPEILTMENNADLNSMLIGKEDYDVFVNFAETYKGQTIQFPGSIDILQNYKTYNTRYEFLLSYGDYNEVSQTGPSFKIENVGTSELKETLIQGQNVMITAKVDRFDYDHGLFYLDYISIVGR